MADIIKIVRNASAGVKTYLGQILNPSDTYTIPFGDFRLWAEDVDVLADVASGDLVVNDGTSDLSTGDGTIWIKLVADSTAVSVGGTTTTVEGAIGAAAGVNLEEDDTPLGQVLTLNFEGAGLSTTDEGSDKFTIDFSPQSNEIPYDNTISGLTATDVKAAVDELASTPSGVEVEDDNVSVNPQATTLNFGDNLSVVDDGSGQVTITGVDPVGNSLKGVDIANTSAVALNTSFQDVPLNSERVKDSIFTHTTDSAEITITATGRYIVLYSLSTQTTSGNSRAQSEGRLVLNGSPVANSLVELYNRNSGQGGNSASRSFILDLTSGDVLKIQVRRQAGGTAQATIPGGSALVIYESKGPKGDKGDTGSAAIDIQDDGTPLVGNPYDTINFANGLTATDAGGGVVQVIADEMPSADDVSYDNVSSGLTATDVQAAIDELSIGGAPTLQNLFFNDTTTYSTTSNGYVTIFTANLTSLPSAGKYLIIFTCEYTNSDKQKQVGTRLQLTGTTLLDVRNAVSVDGVFESRVSHYVEDLTTSDNLTVAHGQTDDGGSAQTRNIRITLVRLEDT